MAVDFKHDLYKMVDGTSKNIQFVFKINDIANGKTYRCQKL